MNCKFLISKIMYNLYDYPDYPKIIRIIQSNKDYTIFRYTYILDNIIYEDEISIENLFRWFNVLKPELVISLKKINNKNFLLINRYRGEDEDLYREIGLLIDILNPENQKFVEYVYLDTDGSLLIKNSKTIKLTYVYYNDEIKNILNNFITDRKVIEYIIVFVYEFIGRVLHLFTIDNENAIKNILSLNQAGQQFLLFITNQIIDFDSVNIFIYDYKYNLKNFIQYHHQYNLLLLKYKDIVYIIIFKEKKIWDRTEQESGFSKNELSIFLKKKI